MAKLYFAYGSNLNKRQMTRRCPDARPLSLLHLENWKLVFRGVADIVPSPGDFVSGGVWVISDNDERALDIYEGYRGDGSGMYRKVGVPIEPFKMRGETFTELMFYVMNSDGIMPPSEGYLASIREGFKDFGLRLKPLNDAVEASWDDKNPSHVERRRHARKGRPTLAVRPSSEKKKAKVTVTNSEPTPAQRATWQRAMTIHSND